MIRKHFTDTGFIYSYDFIDYQPFPDTDHGLSDGSRDSTEEATSVCAARELEEETGYRAAKMELLITVSTKVAFCNETIDVYLATELTPTQQHLDEDEFVEVECFTIDELKDMVLTQKIQDSKTAAAIMAYYGKYCID